MQCKEFEAVLEQQGIVPLPDIAQEHLADCPACQGLLADLSAIVVSAKQIPGEVDPPQRIWISLRAQLTAEGVIKEPEVVEEKAPWWQNFGALLKPRALATAGVGLALGIAALLQMRTPVVVTKHDTPRIEQSQAQPALPQVQRPAPATSPSPAVDVYRASSAALNQVENNLPSSGRIGDPAVDAALRKNLKTVNEFIAECEQHLKQYPNDELAREYLYGAYQQKAELLAAMMDRGRGEQ